MPSLVKLKQREFCQLQVKQNISHTLITMKLFTGFVRTEKFPQTYPILSKFLPSIFSSKCFNEKKLPFADEVLNTEIGHLFEHILLEYLTKLKHLYHDQYVSYSGLTYWDWTKGSFGVFHIKVNAGKREGEIFEESLELSLKLLNRILSKNLIKNLVKLR